jgi:hypothetical protein
VRPSLAVASLAALASAIACEISESPLEQGVPAGGSTSGGAGAGGAGEPGGGAIGGEGSGGSGDAGGAPGEGGSGGRRMGVGCASSPAALLLCDDFESGGIDPTLWTTIENNGGSVQVDDKISFEGTYALRVTLPSAGAASGALRANDLFPLAENAFYGRAYLYVSPAVPDTHSKAITARGDVGGEVGQYRLDCNGGEFNSRYTTPTIDQDIQHGGLKKFGYDVPSEAWLCVEWHYDGENHEMRYWVDGEPIDSMTVLSTEEPQWTAPTFEVFEIGWHTYQAGTTASSYDIYYDAIVLASERVGCGR